MKKTYILIFLLHIIVTLAQPETGNKSKFFPIKPQQKIINITPPLEKPAPNNPFANAKSFGNEPSIYQPSSGILKNEKKPAYVIGENRESILDSKPTFINPNAGLVDKLNGVNKPVTEDFKAIRGNQDLGNFNLNAKFVNIRYRDFGEVDGDQIRIYVNGIVVAKSITLANFFQGLEIALEKGFNKIDFEALNQGTIGPNTAEFQVFDDNKNLVSSNYWNLVTGFKASIMVTKQ